MSLAQSTSKIPKYNEWTLSSLTRLRMVISLGLEGNALGVSLLFGVHFIFGSIAALYLLGSSRFFDALPAALLIASVTV